MLGRYFYFESNGSSANTINFYTEIQIVDTDGVNRASGRGLARYSSIHPNSKDPSVVTDGDTNTNNFFANVEGRGYIVIDLGDVYDISYIKIWRYYGDGRTFKGVYIRVSIDDVNYTTVFSSEVDGTYKETSAGKQIDILNMEHDTPEEPEVSEGSIAKDGLVLYYDAIDNAGEDVHDSTATTWKDLSGNGNDATIIGAVFEGNKLSLDGIDDWVNCGRRDYKKLTVEAYIEHKRLGQVQNIFGNWQSGGYGVLCNANTHEADIYIGGWQNLYGSAPEIGKKYLLTATYDGATLKLYENGVLVDSVTKSGSISSPSSSTVLSIGSNPKGSAIGIDPFAGYVYSARLYDRALTEEEVSSNYNYDNARFNLKEADVDRFYYNGVLLPAIPADVLAAYPYAWIRKDDANAYYDLMLSDNPFYWKSSTIYESGGNTGRPYYRISQFDAERATKWTDYGSHTYSSWTWSENRTVLWSNHDMPYNSPTATVFYIRGSEPIKESEYVDQSGKKAYYNGVLLPVIPQDALAGRPYAWIRRTPSTGVCELICFPNGAYYDGSSIWDKGPVHGPRYKTTIGSNAENWEYVDCTYSAYGLSSSEVLWSNHDIPNGSATATDIYVYGSEPESELPEEPEEPESPEEYTELDYIQSSGTQYIDTGICANPHSSIEVSFRLTKKTDNWDTIFGARNGSYSRYTARFKNSTDGVLGIQYSSTGTGKATVQETTHKKSKFTDSFRVIKYEKNVVYLDGVKEYTFSEPADNVSYPYPLYLFANNDAGTAGDFGYFQISYCKIWNDTELVRDFIPASRNSDGVIGLYDNVSGTFYTNNGTGEFTGVKKIQSYTSLEYIQSSGTQYIDTGYCPTANTRVIADTYINNKSVTTYIYGSKGNGCDFATAANANWYSYAYYGNAYKTKSATYDNGRNTIDHNKNVVQVVSGYGDDTINVADATFDGVSPYSLYICACNNAGVVDTLSTIRIYSFKIYDGETLVRDFIPVQNSEGINGLYDLVNDVFYTNQGSGVFMSNLPGVYNAVPPHEYTKLEYIQSDGNQYINTGFYPTAYTRVRTNITVLSSGTLINAYGSKYESCSFYAYRSANAGWYSGYGNTYYNVSVTSTSGLWIIDHVGHAGVWGNDTYGRYINCSSPTFSGTNPYPMYIFGCNDGTEPPSNPGTMRLEFFRVYDEGNLVRWFVPVKRKSDNEVGLYDAVTGVFYTNQGTGAFIEGPELPDDEWREPFEKNHTALEFIQSSGTQYIDTGYYPNANTRVEADLFIYNYKEFTRIYGVAGNNQNFAFRLGQGTYVAGVKYPAWILSYGETAVSTSITQPIDRGRHKIDHAGATVAVTGPMDVCNCSLTGNSTFSGTSSYPLYIFAINNGETPVDISSFSLYSFKIYDGETLVRDFKPAQRNDGVIGLYDHVEGVFYTNSGSGEFSSNLPYIPPRLPRGYTELEYIESDGSQYIDTGFCATSHTHAYIEVIVQKNEPTTMIYGSYGDSCNFAHTHTSSKGYTLQYCSSSDAALLASLGHKTSLDHTGSSSYVNDGTYGRVMWVEYPTFDNNNPYPMYLFTVNNAGVPEPSNAMRLYIFKVRDAGIMARCLVPAKRNSDGEIGMYDTINDVFYTNAGTGTFIAGPEIVYTWAPDSVACGTALISGIARSITGGMTMLNGIVRTITEGVTIINGAQKKIVFVIEVNGTPVSVSITGTGHENYCYASIGGSKLIGLGYYIGAHTGDVITFGVCGSAYDGWVKINGADVLRITNKTSTYDWTIPDGVTTIAIALKFYNDASATRRGNITVTTS